MIAVAWRCENVFFENSFYHFAPIAGALVDAANSMIGDRMLYASAYPFSPISETLERFRALPFTLDVAENMLCSNADKLLRRIANNRAAASVGRTGNRRMNLDLRRKRASIVGVSVGPRFRRRLQCQSGHQPCRLSDERMWYAVRFEGVS
jgi:hypothetical protein